VAVARVPGPTLVASFDVCGLRAVNADVGHDAGDRVLRAVAERLEGALPAGPLARCHGDLFLWAGPLGPLTAEGAAGVLRDALAAAQRPVAARDREGRPVDVPVLLCGGGVLADAALGVSVPPGAAVET
jgi:GGDEF domain-containing protein